jgi:two-component system, NarL family, nitrate/nitrite response regulator NarL
VTDRIRVVVVDDHPLFREGVVAILSADPGIEVVGQGESAQVAVQLAYDLLPDITLLDIDMPGGGLQAVQSIAATCPVVKIVMLTVSADEDHVINAFKLGAHAYVLKGIASRELISVLRAVVAGEGYVTPSLAANVLSEMASLTSGGQFRGTVLEELTERERQILELIAVGASNREISQQVYLTEKTVKHYVTNILQKLHVRNRVQAALIAQRGDQPA